MDDTFGLQRCARLLQEHSIDFDIQEIFAHPYAGRLDVVPLGDECECLARRGRDGKSRKSLMLALDKQTVWFSPDHRLDREQVQTLVAHLQRWLDTGSLQLPESEGSA